jgi:hypothetical protein
VQPRPPGAIVIVEHGLDAVQISLEADGEVRIQAGSDHKKPAAQLDQLIVEMAESMLACPVLLRRG